MTYEYDALRRATKKTADPINWNDGTGSVVLNAAGLDDAWSYQYDVFGNLSRVTDPLSHYTTYDHDALDRLTRTTLHNGADTVLEYDNLGNLKKVTDPAGNATSYTSDYLHRRRSEQTSFGTESYLYDLAGNLIWKKDRLDQITRYDFDKLGRVVQERWKNAAGTTIRTMPFTFDNLGRLVGAADATSGAAASYGFVYDALGRVTQATHALGGMTSSVVVDQAYDASGNRTQLKAKVGTTNDFVNNYMFDALDRVTQITQQSQTGGNAVAAKRIDLAYDASDRLSYIWRYSSLDTSEYVGRVKYIAYDKAGRLTDMKYDGGGITTIDYDVRYNEHLLDYATITTSAAVTIDFGYDTVDQVNSVDYTGTGMPADVNYSYDDAGNRTNTGYSTGAMNRLTSDGVYNYQYDARGNRTLWTKISDNTKTEYTWDHRNRLTGVKFKSAAGTVTKEVQFSYDAFNRLVRRRLDADGAGAGGFTDTFWVYDGEQAILEFSNGAATAPSHRYLWGPAVDQILADEQVATGSPADVRWPLTDWQGTIRDVATYNAATNVTTIANHKVYEAFGKVHSESGPTVDTVFGFTGRYFDDDTGLQWNLNRWYDPGVGRWLSEDPIRFGGRDPNLYRYLGNSPGMFGDPRGQDGSGFNLAMLQGMAEQYAQNSPTPADAFIGSLASQAENLLSTYVEGGYYLATSSSARSDFGRSYYETRVQSLADRLYNKAKMRGYSDGRIGDWWAPLGEQVLWDVIPVDPTAEWLEKYDMGTQCLLEGVALQQRGCMVVSGWCGIGAGATNVAARTIPGLGRQMYPQVCSGEAPIALRTPSGGQLQKGATLYRVHGGAADQFASSWTTVDPTVIPNYRAGAGLFPGNTGQSVTVGRLTDLQGVFVKPPMPGPTTPPGALMVPEIIVPNPALQIRPITTFDVRPPF